jgi:hypothetical protein
LQVRGRRETPLGERTATLARAARSCENGPMFRLLGRVQLFYVGLFLAACVAVLAYEAYYVWPMQACEKEGRWWSIKYRECATPIPIWRLTGRIPQGTNPISPTPLVGEPVSVPPGGPIKAPH